ncbi:histidine phosphatase family protein [Desulfospira joergensenii]|uniref:histidine phosphatase family protein n=1 Tax=Desulfospira joergensenii TaxID=53329 RepID=UPI0003B4C632|nr:histidine phosphatase family protein [Desulfospira joergensenii]
MTTRVILVSHALTPWNLQGRVQGHTDVPLHPLGWEMARWLGRQLAGERVDAIYTSDLIRAVQTALPCARQKSIQIKTDIRLREGRSILQERSALYPTLDFSKEVETKTDLFLRMNKALSEIAGTHGGESLLVVSHAAAVDIFINALLEKSGDTSLHKGTRMALNFLCRTPNGWQIDHLEKDHFLKVPDQGRCAPYCPGDPMESGHPDQQSKGMIFPGRGR